MGEIATLRSLFRSAEKCWEQGALLRSDQLAVINHGLKLCDALEAERGRAEKMEEALRDTVEELTEIRAWFRAEYSRDDSAMGMFIGTSVEKDVYAIDDTLHNARRALESSGKAREDA